MDDFHSAAGGGGHLFILAELYCLLRNPAVLGHPLGAGEAVDVIETYRTHPRWRLIGFPAESRPLHDTLWHKARATTVAFRRLYDTRSALTMTAQGVTEFATVNTKDFEELGFPDEAWLGASQTAGTSTPSRVSARLDIASLAAGGTCFSGSVSLAVLCGCGPSSHCAGTVEALFAAVPNTRSRDARSSGSNISRSTAAKSRRALSSFPQAEKTSAQ